MKILMVNKFLYPKGGAETYMLSLATQLEKDGHEVQFFGMDSRERCAENAAGLYVTEMNYQTAGAVKKLLSPIKTIYSSEAKRKLGAVIDAFQPDIVHLNNINFQLTPSVIYAAKQRGVPVVQTVHDVQIACPNHRMYIEQTQTVCTECLSHGYGRCIKNKCIHNSALQSAVAAAESMYYHKRGTYNLVDAYICPSRFIAEQIIKGGVEEKRIRVLPNYAPEKAAARYEKAEAPYLLYFGRISVEKGLRLLLDVMEQLPDITLKLAGTGPLEEELKARGLKNVSFLGFTSGEALHELIAGARASVYPSQWFENCPMSVIESIELGTPVITCDIGGTKELIENGRNGVIYEADNKAALSDAIRAVMSDKEKADAMSAYCLEHGSTDPLSVYAEKTVNIYKELMQ